MAISAISDHSDEVAVTSIAFGAAGILGGLFTTLLLGLGSSTVAVVSALAFGGGVGFALWRAFWMNKLSRRAREVQALAEAAATALSEPGT
jgi:hypothetical protein